MKKRLTALLLVMDMVLGMLPTTALVWPLSRQCVERSGGAGKIVSPGSAGCWPESLCKDECLRVFRGLFRLLDHQQAECWENGMAASRGTADLCLL